MKATLQHLLSLLAVLFSAFSLPAGTVLSGINTEPGSGVEVEVSTVFDSAPQQGSVPMRVRIVNATGSDGVWRFHFSGRLGPGLVNSAVFRVKAGETRVFPVAPIMEERSPIPPVVRISGPQVIGGQATLPDLQEGRPFVALSRTLGGSSVERFKTGGKPRTTSRSFGVAGFEPAELPEDWRGLAGVEWLLMTEAEWAALNPEVRTALRRWVAFGGELVLASPDPATCQWSPTFPPPGPQLSGKGPNPYGSGRFRAVPWNGSEVSIEALKTLVASRQWASPEPDVSEWPLFTRLDTLKSHNLFVALFVVVFATLVGPVNLFWLAPAGRRHRLFVTTPLLSLGGTFILLLAMYVTDGTGGTGGRFTAIELLPGGHEALVTQDQVARTGLLLSSRFTLKEEALLLPFKIPDAPPLEKQVAGGTYSGGWFLSRSLQAQQLAAIRPGRRVVTQTGASPSGAPVIVSDLGNAIETLLFRDAGGSLWKGSAIRRGEPVALEPVPENQNRESAQWWKAAIADAFPGRRLSRFKTKPLPDPGQFYATLVTAAGLPVETLDSIDWEDRAVAFGPVEGILSAPLNEGGAP
ncbi:MAG TPA: hypothetical protein VNQ90_07330 [Chthoniobacteraceae bacterium]|nr:hypothetical protein [Chthoniobacteraceae bacterium]